MTTPNYLQMGNGTDGRVQVGAAYLRITDFNAEPKCNLEDVSNSEGNGWEEFIAAFKGMTGSFTAKYDSNDSPFVSLSPGDTVAITITLTTGMTLVFSAIISGLPITGAVKGTISYTCNFTATGEVTLPS
jgi:hypothetical protein